MGVTVNFSFPYPEPADAPNGPAQMGALAAEVDATLESIVSALPYPTVTAFKATDTSRATNDTPAADPDLSLSVAASATYVLEGYLNYEGGTLGASDLQIVLHSVGTLRYQVVGGNPSAAPVIAGTIVGGEAVALGTTGATNLKAALIRGTIINASGSGTLALWWAQNTSNGTATILHAGSWISLRRIA